MCHTSKTLRLRRGYGGHVKQVLADTRPARRIVQPAQSPRIFRGARYRRTRGRTHDPSSVEILLGNPVNRETDHFGRVLKTELLLDMGAVRLDGFDAQVQHLCD